MKHLLTLLLTLGSLPGMAQGTAEDYHRAFHLNEKFNNNMVSGTADEVRWASPDRVTFTLGKGADKREMQATIDADGKVSITQRESDEQADNRGNRDNGRGRGRAVQRGDFKGKPTMKAAQNGPVFLEDHWMNVDEQRKGWPATSPDSSLVAFIKDYNVWVCDTFGKNARQLSFDGTLSHYYSAYIRWSPDGKYIAVNKVRPVEKRYVYYVESSPATQTQPILHQQEYAKPGDELQQEYPHVFEVATGKAIVPKNDLFPNPYELRGPEWTSDSRAITFEYNERGHKVFRVLEMQVAESTQANTGKRASKNVPQPGDVRILVEEKQDKYVNYNRYYRHLLADGRHMLWMSERDNWTHLYSVDLEGGNAGGACPLRQITKGEWVIRKVLRIDEDKQEIWFTASGVNKGEDPYHIHYYKIGFDGQNMVALTPEDGNHNVQFNADHTWLIDTYSKTDMAPVTVMRPVSNPTQVTELGRGDLSALKAAGWTCPEVFTAPGRDGKTLMWGNIYRPSNFDPTRRYPIIEYIYAGPGDAYTPKSFQVNYWYAAALCELGFIVVQLDAMGTSYRGKTFEEVCYKNLKDAGFPDRELWIKAAAEKYPYMDIDNVGIYGCSAGGQESTTAVLLHGDFYKAAYSACGCHDNRMDKIWWNEQWMGYPVDSSYVECSNVYNAHKLKRPLMLVVGECDDNVDPASTMQVANALIKAGKNFELVVIPGARHTMGESFGDHKRYDFFVKHLLHRDPPAWEEVSR